MAQAAGGLRGRMNPQVTIETLHTQLKRLCSEAQHLTEQLEAGEGNDAMKNTAAQHSSQLLAGLSQLEQMIEETDGQQHILWRRCEFCGCIEVVRGPHAQFAGA